MGAGGGARFVGAIGAVAEVVVQPGDGELYGRRRDTIECIQGFVEFSDCACGQSVSPTWGAAYLAEDEHSGPTPRGRGASAAAIELATAHKRSNISSRRISNTAMTEFRSPRRFEISDMLSIRCEAKAWPGPAGLG